MDLDKIKIVHIVGIGGCASSAIAELLVKNGVLVSGSELKYRKGLEYLEQKKVKIVYSHKKENLYIYNKLPDVILYSPAVVALDPDNPELLEAKQEKVFLKSWQSFIGDYLNSIGKIGITVSGSEGKGTTAGILTTILKETSFDPLSILGAKVKGINAGKDSNIYFGGGDAYILEGDEYNRNFYNYHPAINIMINFEYEHPETYKNFNEYKEAFFSFFNGMHGGKKLIFRATRNIIDFVNEYGLDKSHDIIWFGQEEDLAGCNGKNFYIIKNHKVGLEGNAFLLKSKKGNFDFKLNALPGYMVYNASAAIIAALELGLSVEIVKSKLLDFKGMVRRFELYRAETNGFLITDYGHSPSAIEHIIKEIRGLFESKKLHLVFQPHLFSRTYNFFDDFIKALKKADRVTLIDIYPARESSEVWENKVSSSMLCEKLKSFGVDVFYAGKSMNIASALEGKINFKEVTCFMGAGDMDLYYTEIFNTINAISYF